MCIVHETVNRLTNVEAFAKRTHDLEQLTSSIGMFGASTLLLPIDDATHTQSTQNYPER